MPNRIKASTGGITAPAGFKCSAVSCGIKNPEVKRLDLAAIYSEIPAVTVGAFTTNRVKAAPVKVSQQHLKTNNIRAIVVNSGNANACTGPRGITDAKVMAKATAEALGLEARQVLVASTGIIGVPMPMERITPKVPELIEGLKPKNSDVVARAIMTSDTRPKSVAVRLKLGKATVRIGAVAKGAGMICPSMATMLCFVTTDARIGKLELKRAMEGALENSFNRISVDGDMSTNDAVMVMANGAAKNRTIKSGTPSAELFRMALEHVMLKMAKALVRDGERVTKFVEVQVRGAKTYLDARRVAEAVANSLLVKSSWNGQDPNWGRVMHAVGYARAKVKEDMVDIYFGGLAAAKNGIVADTPLEKLIKVVEKDEFSVTIDLNLGTAEYHVFTSDLSPEYVDFNRAEYAAMKVR
ncbi:MAG: bifunctional glutamate N-acetyltransferase/amino-acid acetyltransferase ArgJ [Verrucomicrobiales bacterium]|nr:bifunctional glutamate N-acetyltransferase/amino-acid acetyltransferase ArgJ [Verrucomicrobiales bacterium]